ncbi:MAG: hypothetical protein M3Z29_10615 [Pseudomonadota bacterium]|nr:hypothetical protein [Pseudomonadota bacterium]
MKKSAMLLVAGLAASGFVFAGSRAANVGTTADAPGASASAPASALSTTRVAAEIKGNLSSSSSSRDSGKDPYTVPLFKDAKQLR